MIHKSYSSGDKYKHTARRETDISRVLNGTGITGIGAMKSAYSNNCKVNVCHKDGLPAGTPVKITKPDDEGKECFRCEKATDNKKPWGVVQWTLAANEIGAAVFSGFAFAKVSGQETDGEYAEPADGGLKRVKSGTARIVYADDKGQALLLLQGSQQETGTTYDGPFAVSASEKKLSVASGWILRNGESVEFTGSSIDAADGILCVCTTLDENGGWSAPELKFCDPAPDAHPIAEIKTEEVKGDPKEGSSEKEESKEEEKKLKITIRQFPVTVAVINLVMVCPLAEL